MRRTKIRIMYYFWETSLNPSWICVRHHQGVAKPEVGKPYAVQIFIDGKNGSRRDSCVWLQVLRMEHLLLKVLRFDVAVPTANVFCDRFLKEAEADEKTVSLAMVCRC